MQEKIGSLAKTDVYDLREREARYLDLYYCSHCGRHTDYPVPVEPIYFLDDVYKLIPFPTIDAMKVYMSKRKDEYPPMYVKVHRLPGTGGNRFKRVVRASEIRKLRESRISAYKGPSMNRSSAPRDDKVWKVGERRKAQERNSRGEV